MKINGSFVSLKLSRSVRVTIDAGRLFDPGGHLSVSQWMRWVRETRVSADIRRERYSNIAMDNLKDQ